ncbi:hypothetical protein KR018_004936, partial [Drosophila ironensis]
QTYESNNIAVTNLPGKMWSNDYKLVGRERMINGTLEIFEDISNDLNFMLELYSNSGFAGYKLMPMEVPSMPVCAALRSYYSRFIKNSFLTGITTSFDFDNGNVCPLPKGKYYVKDLLFDTTDWAVILPRGLIKARLILMDKEEFVGGVEFIVEIKDKI